jgi:hypothetical protein
LKSEFDIIKKSLDSSWSTRRGEKVSPSSSSSLLSSYTLPNPEHVCDDDDDSSEATVTSVIMTKVQRHWNYIDSFVAKQQEQTQNTNSKLKVSGGIFLYPRQATILTYLIQRIKHEVIMTDKKWLTICETGFGSGHSMALFHEAAAVLLAAAAPSRTRNGNIDTRIVSFDKFDRPYQLPLWHYLNETSTNVHHEYYAGNSCETVPKLLSPSVSTNNNNNNNNNNNDADADRIQCDILHGSSLCPTDNIDLVENSPCGVLLTSTGKFRLFVVVVVVVLVLLSKECLCFNASNFPHNLI